jgi:formate hydrogenlyase transcriptional activator
MRIGKPIDRISDEALMRLCQYDWPGNVRELENILERALILSAGPALEIDPELLDLGADRAPHADKRSLESLGDLERAHIRKVLDESAWIIEGSKGAARILEMHPNTLRSRMKKLGIVRRPPDSTSGSAADRP